MIDLTKLIDIEPGCYVVGVSGGIDSMVLMDVLSKYSRTDKTRVIFVIAHFDHGIRDDSRLDRILVGEEARVRGMPFVYGEGGLGYGASEELAREARYNFLFKVKASSSGRGILLAHHMDDVIETAVHNVLRGTGRLGLTSLKSTSDLLRPLLLVPKQIIMEYAKAYGIKWREDLTNSDTRYTRNYIRHDVLKRMRASDPSKYSQLIKIIKRQSYVNTAISSSIEKLLHDQPSRKILSRDDVISLPFDIAKELVAQWLRQNGKNNFSSWLINRLTVLIRTSVPHKEFLLDSRSKVKFEIENVEFIDL